MSQEQADAVTSGADASPDDEDALLESARRDPVHELKKNAAAARARADKDPAATRRRQHKLRSWRKWIDDDGMSNHHLRLPPDLGAEVDAALTNAIDRAFADARAAGRYESRDAYAADAVFGLLTGRQTSRYTNQADTAPDPDTTTETEPAPRTDGAPDAATKTGMPTTTRPAATQTDDNAHPGPASSDTSTHSGDDIGHNPAPAEQATPGRNGEPTLFPDFGPATDPAPPTTDNHGADRSGTQNPGSPATEPPVPSDTGPPGPRRGPAAGPDRAEPLPPAPPPNPLDPEQRLPGRKSNQAVRPERKVIVHVTHLGRQVTAHQRTALEARGYECEVDGCGTTHHLDIDHITGWTLTETTTINDLAWLCRHHHDQKTLSNLILTGPPGKRQLTPRTSTTAA